MNVAHELKKIHGNEIYTAAYLMDQEAVERIEASYQEAWDSGSGFTPATMFGLRGDVETELAACAGQMQSALKDLIVKRWLSSYEREEITTLCNLLLKGPQHQYTCVRLVGDLEIDAGDIARSWSDLHRDERPVYPPDPDIG